VARTYGVELLCASLPSFSKEALREAVRARCPSAEPLGGETLALSHADHLVHYADRSLPAQTRVLVADAPPGPGTLTAAVQQSHTFPGAEAALMDTRATVMVTDYLSSGLHPVERLDLFQRALLGVLDVIDCVALHWCSSERIVDPTAYRDAAASEDPTSLFFAGPLNVRMFNVADRWDGEVLMDTMGLGALGLPDLQCHFRELDPNSVARVLYNTGWYVFTHGDVLEDGQTVEGIGPESSWHCQREDALVAPSRLLVDLNPGAPFAAGNR
jgi:hypothetical protein